MVLVYGQPKARPLELLLLLGAGGLGLWAILTEPIQEVHAEWRQGRDDARAQATASAQQAGVEKIDQEITRMDHLIGDPRTPID